MGNCFAMNQLVHPSDLDLSSHDVKDLSQPGSTLRIKVRMTAREYKNLMEQADLSKDNTTIGYLIVQECLKGKSDARIISWEDKLQDCRNRRSLEAISEEEN